MEYNNLIKRSIKEFGIHACIESSIIQLSTLNKIICIDKNTDRIRNMNDAIVFTVGNNDLDKPDVIFLCGPMDNFVISPDILINYVQDVMETTVTIGMANTMLQFNSECTTIHGRIYSEQTYKYYDIIPPKIFQAMHNYYKGVFEYIIMAPIGYEM